MTDVVCLLLLVIAIGAIGYAIAARRSLHDVERKYRQERIDSTDLRRQVHELSGRLNEANRDLAQWRKRAHGK